MKLYNPDKCNSFEMMFGFTQPPAYMVKKNYIDKRTKKYGNKRKYENERQSEVLAKNVPQSKR